ncbi:MAG: phosphatidylcholine/phosphatidylserine synthase [Phycisphaerales bacterium]
MTEQINKSERAKRSLLKNVRKQRLKYITVLPSLVTLINGACGFASIVFASRVGHDASSGLDIYSTGFPFFKMAGYMIFFAMIADMLDGHLARLSHNTSSFGGQLDSLCDVISFGIAPAFLMLRVVETNLNFGPHIDVFIYRFLWLAAAIYFSCAAIRLARFNVENEEDESHHMSFSGLPSPAAAGAVASLIILNQEMLMKIQEGWKLYLQVGHAAIIYILPFATLIAGALMVSRVRYPHLVNQYLKGKKPFSYLIKAVAIIVIVIWYFEVALVLVFWSFALSGILKWAYNRIIAHKPIEGEIEEEDPPVVPVSH